MNFQAFKNMEGKGIIESHKKKNRMLIVMQFKAMSELLKSTIFVFHSKNIELVKNSKNISCQFFQINQLPQPYQFQIPEKRQSFMKLNSHQKFINFNIPISSFFSYNFDNNPSQDGCFIIFQTSFWFYPSVNNFSLKRLYIILEMRFLNILRNAITRNDLFYSTQMLRYDKELEYRTFTGGLLSLGIIIAVIVGFANMIMNTISLNTLSVDQVISKDTVPTLTELHIKKDSKFMMAVELWGVNMSGPTRLFDVLMIQLNTTSGQRIFNYSLVYLETCTKEHWSDFPQIASEFDKLSMSNWLCPPQNTTLYVSGDFTDNFYQYINISVNPCMDILDPLRPCANKDQLQQAFDILNDAIRFKIYYTNPLINPGQKEYKSYYLQSSNYIMFGATIGGEAYLYISDYQITTDNSIWPYSHQQYDKGILIEDKLTFHPYTTFRSTYASYLVVKSPTRYSYKRIVQKISTVFSFIGGLISAISTALFILKLYNNLTFEISLALCIFKPPDGSTVDPSNLGMNFFTFFKFYIFKICRKIESLPKWPEISFLSDCQEEIVKQLDVKALIKRIIFLEYCMTNLFEDYQLEGLQLQKPKTPQDICKIRQKCQSLDIYDEHHFMSTKHLIEDIASQNLSNIAFPPPPLTPKIDIIGGNNEIMTPSNLFEKEMSLDQPQKNDTSFKQKTKPFCEISDNKQVVQPVKNQRKSVKNHRKQISEDRHKKFFQERRSINLSILKKNAQEGNTLSKKIWFQLQNHPVELNQLKRRRKLV